MEVLYQCIGCGKTRESEKPCTCPDCGYRMFPAPYERSQILVDEINRFVQELVTVKLSAEEMRFFREEKAPGKKGQEHKPTVITKTQDDQRFPGFDKIQGYVCAGKKAEDFFSRLTHSLEEIRTHIHERYQREYKADLNGWNTQLELQDRIVINVQEKLGRPITIQDHPFPEITMLYQEASNPELIDKADVLLQLLNDLSGKVKRFIRLNNIYGSAYQQKQAIRIRREKELSDEEKINSVIAAVETALQKKYELDIFSDGTEELREMLRALWTGIYALLTVPVLAKTETYLFPDGRRLDRKACLQELEAIATDRYCTVSQPFPDWSAKEQMQEEELFALYNSLIELDQFGYLGVNASRLIRQGESEKELNELIGLSGIKDSIKKIKAYALANKGTEALNLHMCFYGNPGTGKTEVARILAGILYENKILPTKKLVEVDRGGLVGQYVGETPQKTMYAIQSAMGGVLFIDEAYALIPEDGGGWDYGHEAVATLVKAMEDYRGKFCVILAGYRNQMLEMLSSNPGFRSRIQFELDFPNYSRQELSEISDLMLRKRQYTMEQAAKERMLDITDIKRKSANFANAREIRNLLDQIIMCQSVRAIGTDDRELGLADVNQYIQDAKLALPGKGETEKKILTGDEELERLIGLGQVKRMVKKIKAFAKRNLGSGELNLHMCFLGNPGTGKTEVARILSRILYDAGVLPESKLIETDSTGLIGKYVGETGPKTQRIVQDALGGVLFIDEAYALAPGTTSDGSASSYGDEAIAVLLKEMEDRRGQVCVVLAGYKNEMNQMLDSNPGFKSRIPFVLEFPDYSREELGEIAVSFLSEKGYEIEESALSRLLDITDYYRQRPNFANARTVRTILDQVILNQNLRAEDDASDCMIITDDVDDYITDEKIDLSAAAPRRRIGF